MNKVSFQFNLSDLSVQPLSFKSISFLEDLIQILKEDIEGQSENYQSRLSFIWAFQVKEVAVLFRDACVHLLRFEQYVKDELKSEAELEEYKNELYNVVEAAVLELEDTYVKCEERNAELNAEWEHQFNPAPTIIQQVEKLVDQIKTIQRSQLKLDRLTRKFEDYRSSYLEHMQQREESLSRIKKQLISLKEGIEAEEDKVKRSPLVKLDNQIVTILQKIENDIVMAPYQFIVLEDVNRLKIAVDTQGGQLVYKSVDVLSEVSGWTSFNLASPLKTIDTKIQAYKEKVIVGLIQLSNRIKAKMESTNGEEVEIPRTELSTPIQKLISEFKEDIVINVLERLSELKVKLETFIQISQLFSKEYNFLPSSAIGQLTGFAERSDLQRRYNPQRIRGIVADFFYRIFSSYSNKEQVTAAGFIKKVLDFDSESDANALFLKSGFLGSSFSVERQEIITRIKNHYALWQEGFGGGLLIKGGHLSGRSTILEILPITYPDIPSYHVIPGQKIDVRGYKRNMGDNLIDTLNFIIKYKGPEPCMVTIDDLDYYADHPEQTFDLIHTLCSIVAKYSKKIYFAVVMHSFLYEKINHYLQLSNFFSECVDTDYMSAEQIQSAVLTRAHAVVNNNDMDEQSDALSSLSRKVAKRAGGNIGKAMQMWCMYRGKKKIEELGQSQFRKLVENHHALLKMLIIHGWQKEPEIRKLFNDIDAKRLRDSVRSLVQIKLLERPAEGYIRINPFLTVYVEKALNRMR